MVDHSAIRERMEVIGSDGVTVGRVDSVDGARIKLARTGSPDGEHHYIDASDVARVDRHVHLSRPASAVLGMGAGAAHGGEARKTNWLLWLVLAAGAIALLLALSRCEDRDEAELGTDPVATTASASRVSGAPLVAGTMAYEVDRFLAGSEAAPRTFAFERLNFDSGKATIRDADESDLDDIARVLAAYPSVRAVIVGYTDAEGPAASNTELGAERARAVIAALGERGVTADRLEARTGGESDPEASNASEAGRFANRRTELIVVSR